MTQLLDRPVTLRNDTTDNHSHRYRPVTAGLDALLRRVAQRDRDAFAAFYDATRSRVYGMVVRVFPDHGLRGNDPGDLPAGLADCRSSAPPPAAPCRRDLAHRRAVDRVRSEQAATQRDSPLRCLDRGPRRGPRQRRGDLR